MSTTPLREFYEARVVKKAGCWGWTGTTVKGYGGITIGGRKARKNHYAHRAAWTLYRGPIPPGMHVLHRCHNPICSNPAHLYIGTPKDNMRDMAEAGRHVGYRRMTDAQVAEVRRLREEGLVYEEIGERLGIGRHHASLICRGLRHPLP